MSNKKESAKPIILQKTRDKIDSIDGDSNCDPRVINEEYEGGAEKGE